MTELFVVAPMLVALSTAVVTLVARRWPNLQIGASILGVTVYGATIGWLTWRVVLAPDAPGAVAYQVAGHRAPFGITLVADALSAFMLAMAAVVAVAALVFSVSYMDPRDQQISYHPLFHFMLLGITGAFLTGDLFNLFVWFEVMLMASYAFVVFYGGPEHTRAALWYVVLNIVASAVMLLAIGGLYAATGTLNMAHMASRLADPAASGVRVAPVVGLSTLLFAVFALKAGLVPFQFWVPAAYQAAPLPVTAVLAAATKKVGMYAIIRLYFTVFAAAPTVVELPGIAGQSPLAFSGPLLFVMGVASVAIGGFGAVAATSIEEVLAYSSIGQVGFIAIPIAVAATADTPAVQRIAVIAALVYALNHALSKGLLFLSAAAVRDATGTGEFAELGGIAGRMPVVSGVFFVGMLSLVGIPPLAGFFGKFLVFDAALRGESAIALGALLGGAILTIIYTTQTWTQGFWGEPTVAVNDAVMNHSQLAIIVALALVILAAGVWFDSVYQFADAAAAAAIDRTAYIDAVSDGGAWT